MTPALDRSMEQVSH